jgi:hypothetical protein
MHWEMVRIEALIWFVHVWRMRKAILFVISRERTFQQSIQSPLVYEAKSNLTL